MGWLRVTSSLGTWTQRRSTGKDVHKVQDIIWQLTNHTVVSLWRRAGPCGTVCKMTCPLWCIDFPAGNWICWLLLTICIIIIIIICDQITLIQWHTVIAYSIVRNVSDVSMDESHWDRIDLQFSEMMCAHTNYSISSQRKNFFVHLKLLRPVLHVEKSISLWLHGLHE